MDNQEIELQLDDDNLEIELQADNSIILREENVIESISVNGVEQTVDENKNVDITVPTKLSDLQNDNNTVQDASYVHTDNNFNNTYKGQIDNNTTDITNIKAEQITQNNNILNLQTNKADKSEIPDVSSFITKDVNNLTNYTKTGDMTNEINNAVGNETTARENSDVNLQSQIDAITSASDVVDVVGTYTDLQNYDTSKLTDKDLIKVMQDSTHNNALSYYRWANSVWTYVGSEGPFYTKSESDTLLNEKQTEITSTNKLASDLVDDTNSGNKFVTSSEKASWDAKYDKPSGGIPKTDLASDVLQDYVKNTDYATYSKAGLLKVASWSGTGVQGNTLIGYSHNYNTYKAMGNNVLMAKGTLEAAITGKNLETADNKVTSLDSSSTDTQYPSAKAVYDLGETKVDKSSFVYDSTTETLTITI